MASIGPFVRPCAPSAPGSGLFRHDHFQIAYATNDIDRACALFADRYGIAEYRRLEGQMKSGGHIHVELAWVGGTMIELLTASGPGSSLYVGRLPQDGFAIRHHHLGYMVHDEAAWAAIPAEAERAGAIHIPGNDNPGFLKSCFVEVPELGHYLEYICPEPAGRAFFEGVPVSDRK